MIVAGAIVVIVEGRGPLTYLSFEDSAEVVRLDALTEDVFVKGVVVDTHPFDAEAPQRSRRKRSVRLLIFGEGSQITGTVTLHCDGVREETYPVEGPYDANQGILIWQEWSVAATGFQIDATLRLSGRGLALRDQRLEYTIIQ